VIPVGVAAQENFDIGKLEAEFFDRGFDFRNRVVEVAVDQDVAFGSIDQERAQIVSPHEVNVADNFVGWKGLVEGCVILGKRWRYSAQNPERQQWKNPGHSHNGRQSITSVGKPFW